MVDADWGGHSGSRLGLDIGGTLAKLVFFESEIRPSWCNGRFAQVIKSLGVQTVKSEDDREFRDFVLSRQGSFWGAQDKELSFYDEELEGVFHFLCFQTDKMERFVALLAAQDLHHQIDEIYTTGGGAYKYSRLFSERLGINLKPVDELGVVVKGISWLLRRPISDEVCWLSDEPPKSPNFESECHFLDSANSLFPFILVNIGSGVSIVKVDGTDRFERISGSALGGGTFWGLCNLLCPDCKEFSEASCLAVAGDSSKLNLLVEDIYGGDYELTGGRKLPGTLVASFFAKAGRNGQAHDDAAVLNALITMISQNICQIAFLNSKLHSISRIVFTGNFLRQNQVARQAIATNMRRVSGAGLAGKQLHALFLEHEGYFGALGSFLHNVEVENAASKVPTCQRLPTLLGSMQSPALANALWTSKRTSLLQRTWNTFNRCLGCRESDESKQARLGNKL
ncbi:4'-phosphopantetheine phosphatase (Inactive pantothenic acid kinase 4) [Durusdinium trenchii]|uniref:4'-phosphopantetheine phosphatase (Inactive pantothenic acid kinase 4) n=1 Tax=Durusdinium trenchii TaxID=1381693 RepID=A0ABP0M851_9DINO